MIETPSNSQKQRSAPQKQPIPNIALRSRGGKGPCMALPLTKCRVGTAIFSLRPGKASSALGMRIFLSLLNMTPLHIFRPFPHRVRRIAKDTG